MEIDRRVWVRHQSNLQINLQTAHIFDNTPVPARVMDVSQGGISLIVGRAFERGDLLTIEVPRSEFLNEAGSPIPAQSVFKVLCYVIHATNCASGEWRLGCTFARELTPDDLFPLGAQWQRSEAPEKRGWMRFPSGVKATYQVLTGIGSMDEDSAEPPADPDPGETATVRDVSASGLGLLVDRELEIGTLLNVAMQGSLGHPPLSTLAYVVHVTPREKDWSLGCNFIRELSAEDLQLLMRFDRIASTPGMQERWDNYLDRIRAFIKAEVHDQADALDATHSYPTEIVQKMGQLGVFGLTIPERYGGLEAPISILIEVSLLIAGGWLSLSSIVGSHWRVGGYVLNFGSEEQKNTFLPRMASGQLIAANGHTERHGKDWRYLETALSQNAGSYSLSGAKAYITNATHADLIALTAKCPFPEFSTDGFVVALLPRSHPGLTVGPDLPRLGIRGVHICTLSIDRAPIDPELQLLGKKVGARAISDSSIVPKLLDISARALGIGERLIETSLDRLLEDRSPRPPLKTIPLAKFRCASFAGKIRLATLALRQLAAMADRGQLEVAEAHYLQVFSTETVMEAANETLLLHGGAGYTSAVFLQRCVRDVTSLQIVGTPRDQVFDIYADLLVASRSQRPI